MRVTNARRACCGNRLPLALLPLAMLIALAAPGTAESARSCAYFDFSYRTNINSTLSLTWADEKGRCLWKASWRAGSGADAKNHDDPCRVGIGRLPNGWYNSPSGMTNKWPGSLVRGRVWRLQDKKCGEGQLRTELFIHTEETLDNDQDCRVRGQGDEPWCWDDTRANPTANAGTYDYYSAGCIKVRRASPEGTWAGDVGDMHTKYHDHVTTAHNAQRTDLLFVHKE